MIDFEERSAIIEYDGGLPRMWAEALAHFDTQRPPTNYTIGQWEIVVNDAAILLHHWFPKIVANGWTPADINGLVIIIMGRKITAVNSSEVTVVDPDRGKIRICYRPSLIGPSTWQEGRSA